MSSSLVSGRIVLIFPGSANMVIGPAPSASMPTKSPGTRPSTDRETSAAAHWLWLQRFNP